MKKYQLHLETLTVFLLAGAVRLTSLNVFRAIDEEDRWAWAVEFYKALLAGDLSATLVGDGYPGIFPVWLETLWLILASLYRSALQGSWLNDDGIYLLIHEWQRPAYLGMQRFPVALMNTILVVIIFLYVRHLFGRWTGLLAAILISLDPFYLSDSRVNRAEGLLTGLMAVSLLGLVTALKPIQYINNAHSSFNWRHLLGSALFGGLAWLTKSQSIVLIPMFTVITLIWYLRAETSWPLALRRWFTTMLIWGVGAALIFIILWPAVWTVPGPTFTRMFNYATRKVGAEGVKLFFLGGTILDEDPGFLFYPIIFLLRSTPVMLLGLALSIWLFIRQKFSLNLQSKTQNPKPMLRKAEVSKIYYWLDNNGIWVLLAYAVLYIGGMSLGSHKQDRFLMAAFPIFNILAAMGFVGFFRWFDPFPKRMWVGTAAILIAQLITALPFHPYYFSYFNPLVGGGATAQHLIRIGWGEGMDQVADYLQTLDNPENLDVASRFIHYMPKFEGNILPLGQNGEWVQADKIVLHSTKPTHARPQPRCYPLLSAACCPGKRDCD